MSPMTQINQAIRRSGSRKAGTTDNEDSHCLFSIAVSFPVTAISGDRGNTRGVGIILG